LHDGTNERTTSRGQKRGKNGEARGIRSEERVGRVKLRFRCERIASIVILINVLTSKVGRTRSNSNSVFRNHLAKLSRRYFRRRGADNVEVFGLGCGRRRGDNGDDDDIHLNVLGQAERFVGVDCTGTIGGVDLDSRRRILAWGKCGESGRNSQGLKQFLKTCSRVDIR